MAAAELLALEGPADVLPGAGVPLAEALCAISPELALVDSELAAGARALLPDPVEPVWRLPARIEPERPEPPEPSESAELGRLTEPPGAPEPLVSLEALEPDAAPAPLEVARVVETAPSARRPSWSRPAVRVVSAVALLGLVAGLVVWLGLVPGGEQRSAVGSAEKPLGFSAPSTDPDLAPGAVAALERQARIEPGSSLVREKLGTVYLRLGRWHDAEGELRALVALTPDDAFAHFALGRALKEQGRHADAKKHFTRAAELRANDPSAVQPPP